MTERPHVTNGLRDRLLMGTKDLAKQAAGYAASTLHGILGSRVRGRFGQLVYHRISPEIAGVPFAAGGVDSTGASRISRRRPRATSALPSSAKR